MISVALLTCEKLPDMLPSDQRLIPALRVHGIDAKAVIWDDENIQWETFDYLIFRNTGDYFEKEIKFKQWLELIASLGIKTFNV